jgi:hypothetical protein
VVRLAGHGVAVEVQPGWEARVWRPVVAPPAVPGAVVRLANFALPDTKNTYAAEVADDLRPGHVLVSLVELGPALADRGLYAAQGPTGAAGWWSRTTRGAAVLLAPREGVQPVRDGAARPDARARAARDERQPPVARRGCGMSAPAWIAACLLIVVVIWLGLALIGAIREIAELRDRVDALGAPKPTPVHLGGGLAVGTLAPAWSIATPGGGVASSSAFEGRRHLLVFADATCRACDEVVPELVAAAGRGTVPPLAVIGRGEAEATPEPWRAADVRVRIGSERGDEVSEAFGVDVSPFVFVVDEGGSVVARSGVATVDDVLRLVREAEGVRIVAAGGA